MDYELAVFNHKKREAFRHSFATLSHTSDEAAQKRREWWCFDNPYGGAFALIRAEGEIAATCYLGGKKLLIGGKEFTCFEIGETATDPAHQRKGLFSKLVKAAVSHAATSGGLVYGTPNSQSTPGYAKLGFKIVEDPNSWLFVVASPSYWLRFRLPQLPSRTTRGVLTELSAADYVRSTASFDRLSLSSANYLDWRLGQSPANYRFFKILTQNGEFYCAVKEATLGKYPTIVVAEYYLAGQRPQLSIAVKLLRRVAWNYFDSRRFLGLYLHAPLAEGWAAMLLKAKAVLPHRQLPICAASTNDEPIPRGWFKHFQLSDCDIG